MVFIRIRSGLFGIADIFLIFKKGIIPTFATVTKVRIMLEKNEKDFFYITEFELDELSKFYLEKPLSFVFYSYLEETGYLKKFSLDKCQNFFNRINFNKACFEVLFKDNSVFTIGNGEINVTGFDNNFSIRFEL